MTGAFTRDHVAGLRRVLADPRDVCRRLGLDEGALAQSRGLLVRCPWHADRTPSCSVRIGLDGTIAVRCHGCGATGDALTLVAAANGLDVRRDFPEVLRLAADLGGVDPSHPVPAALPARPAPTPPSYPPTGEVAALWASCVPVFDDAEVSAWLVSRALNPGRVADADVARALPLRATTPRWARCRAGTWIAVGCRCLVPVYDAAGAMRSLRARRIGAGGGPKALPPSGHRSGGLVLADALGRRVLAGRAVAPLRLVVAEGEPDFLTASTAYHGRDDAPAVLGLPGSGAWTAELAARIPSGTRVLVATDPDAAGDRYASEIAASVGRRCEVIRFGGAA